MRTPYLLLLSRHSRLAALTCSFVLLLGPATWAVTSQGNAAPLPSHGAVLPQYALLFFAVFTLAVSGLRGMKAISSLATVRLLGTSMVVATSIFLAFSQLEPGRLMPVMVLLGVSLGLFFSKTEGAELEQREHVSKPPATRDTSQVERPSNGQGQAGIPAARLQEAEENSDASGSSSL